MDTKLGLLHPSLGLAFTTHFTRGHDFLVIGDKAADNLPPNCDGCREDLSGEMICECHFGTKVMP